jgi:hypothetical protein
MGGHLEKFRGGRFYFKVRTQNDCKLKPVVAVTVVFPVQAFRNPAKLFDRARSNYANSSVDRVDIQLLAWLEAKDFADLLRDYDLESPRDFDGFNS